MKNKPTIEYMEQSDKFSEFLVKFEKSLLALLAFILTCLLIAYYLIGATL